jgi:hypothetical protein
VSRPDFSILKARIDAVERQVDGIERMLGSLLIFLYLHEVISDDEFGRALQRYQGKEPSGEPRRVQGDPVQSEESGPHPAL